MSKPTETGDTAPQQALQDAKAALKSARLAAKASKAKLRALKSEVKIQRQHAKWARSQVRVAKQELAQCTATAAAAAGEPEEASAPGHVERAAPVPPAGGEQAEPLSAGDASGAKAGTTSASLRPRAR